MTYPKPSEAILAHAVELAAQGGVSHDPRGSVIYATLKYLDHLVEQHEKANEQAHRAGWHVVCRCAFCTREGA